MLGAFGAPYSYGTLYLADAMYREQFLEPFAGVFLRRGAFDHYVYSIFPDVADHLLLVHSVVRFGHLRLQMGIYVVNPPIVERYICC